ncbi:MAG TPA: Crp/Fnr family transcriptional regulator [Steroidobacteraceae bacterium]|nr:Crp/Fnr family transcriptional regulator [Steroidobacteraceae bacterium]
MSHQGEPGRYTCGVNAAPHAAVIAEQLAGADLFAGLPTEALTEVVGLGRVEALKRGTILFAQGGPAERCHALIAGRVRIAQSGAEGGRVIVRFVGPGDTFGTVALFTDRRYPAEATAVIDSIEISWPEPTLLALIQRYPRIALNLVSIVGARLCEVQERLREVATQRVDQRIAHALLRLVDRRGLADKECAAIEFPLTRQDLAEMCGATLYTVSRVLTAWEKAGLITSRRRQLAIHKFPEIRRLAGEV